MPAKTGHCERFLQLITVIVHLPLHHKQNTNHENHFFQLSFLVLATILFPAQILPKGTKYDPLVSHIDSTVKPGDDFSFSPMENGLRNIPFLQ